MKLQRREKILASLALGLVGLAGLWFLLFVGDNRSFGDLKDDESKLKTEIREKKKQLKAAGQDAKRLAQWQQRSLPPDPLLAPSLYQNWLLSLAKRVDLRETKLESPPAVVRRDQFTRISFTLHAQAKLSDLVEFMYKFYSAGFLHQIRRMDVKPNKNSHDLDVNLTIEALSLPKAESKGKLPDKVPQDAGRELQFTKLADYRPIASRDFFAAYLRPAPPAPPPPKRSVDPADHTIVTGIIEVDGKAQVWLQDRIGNKLWKLGVGESFTVGNTTGTVQSIHPEGDVVVDFDGHRRMLHLEDNLHGGVEIQDQRPNQPDEGVNSTAPHVRSRQLPPRSGTIIE